MGLLPGPGKLLECPALMICRFSLGTLLGLLLRYWVALCPPSTVLLSLRVGCQLGSCSLLVLLTYLLVMERRLVLLGVIMSVFLAFMMVLESTGPAGLVRVADESDETENLQHTLCGRLFFWVTISHACMEEIEGSWFLGVGAC